MATLALVAVSVPLALISGGMVGLLANEFPRFKKTIQTIRMMVWRNLMVITVAWSGRSSCRVATINPIRMICHLMTF